MIKVIDNFVSKQLSDEIENLMICKDVQKFNWYFNDKTDYTTSKKDSFQLTHLFYDYREKEKVRSDYFELVKKLIEKVNHRNIYRVKANLCTNITNYNKKNHQIVHQDMNDERFFSLLYYVNNSDGDTVFFKNKKVIKRVKPKKNKAVIFNSNIEHAGSNPIKSPYRMVINFILAK